LGVMTSPLTRSSERTDKSLVEKVADQVKNVSDQIDALLRKKTSGLP
jgi:hypothetical protein